MGSKFSGEFSDGDIPATTMDDTMRKPGYSVSIAVAFMLIYLTHTVVAVLVQVQDKLCKKEHFYHLRRYILLPFAYAGITYFYNAHSIFSALFIWLVAILYIAAHVCVPVKQIWEKDERIFKGIVSAAHGITLLFFWVDWLAGLIKRDI